MSAVLLRSRPGAPGLRRIGLLPCRLSLSNPSASIRLAGPRYLSGSTRRGPGAKCLASPTFFTSRMSVRYNSTASESSAVKPKSKALNIVYKSFAACGFFIVMSGAAVLAFFIYDATTYKEHLTAQDIPVSELALNPRRGGPKNLPIAEILVDDNDSDTMEEQKDKPRLVVLGTGWGSIALLKNLNPGDYHVTVVSPTNYFLFTPMLPSATVGTLGLRSLVEPVRRIVQRVHGHFLKGEAVDVEFSEKMVEIAGLDANGNPQHFYLPYDKLVIGVGMEYVKFADLVGLSLTMSICRLRNKSPRCERLGILPFPEDNR